MQDIKPDIWRIIQIRGDASLGKLHDYIVAVMGWEDYHLHRFKIDGKNYGVPDPEYNDLDDFRILNERKYSLEKLLLEGQEFEYEYDFGDSWLHNIVVEKVFPAEKKKYYPICISGERNCPPEDCGGSMGYYEMLEALADPNHDRYDEYVEWLGEDFDPEEVNLTEINDIFDNIKGNTREPR